MFKEATDYARLDREQLIARLQIAASEARRLTEANAQLHRMMETLRDNGWAHPRPADANVRVKIRDYPMGLHQEPQQDGRVADLAKKLSEANDRADHWRQKYMNLLDDTGRTR